MPRIKKKKERLSIGQRIKVVDRVEEEEEDVVEETRPQVKRPAIAEKRTEKAVVAKAEKPAGIPEAPAAVAKNEKLLKLWENATDEEREATLLIASLQSDSTKKGIDSYFDFADRWHSVFPKTDKKSEAKGLTAVKNGSKMAGMSSSTVYSILRTTRFYSREGFEALDTKAKSNGVILFWIHLRVLTERLGDNPKARTAIERKLVSTQMTEKQLHQEIDEIAPETVTTRAESKTDVSAISKLFDLAVVFEKLARQKDRYLRVIEAVDNEYDSSVEQGKLILDAYAKLTASFESVSEFITDGQDKLIALAAPVEEIVKHEEKQSEKKKAVEEKAAKIKSQVSDERKAENEKRKKREAAIQLRGDFADEDNEAPVEVVTRKPKPAAKPRPVDIEEEEDADLEEEVVDDVADDVVDKSQLPILDEEEVYEDEYDEEAEEAAEDEEEDEYEDEEEEYDEEDEDEDEEEDDDIVVEEEDEEIRDIFNELGEIPDHV